MRQFPALFLAIGLILGATAHAGPQCEPLFASQVRTSDERSELKDLIREKNSEAFKVLSLYGQSFPILARHPGIVVRLERFIRFLQAHDELRAASPEAAIAAFRNELGTVTLYRALLLSKADLAQIRMHGLLPNFMRNGHTERQMERWILSNGIGQVINLHMSHQGAAVSPFTSFSQDSELARLVAVVPNGDSRSRYVFQVKIDVLDIVYLGLSGSLIEEALVYAHIGPEQILNLAKVEGEHYRVSISDMLEDRRWIPSGPPIIPTENQPKVTRPLRK